MGRGKYKSKPTGHRQFSSREDLLAGTSTRPRSFSKREAEHEEEPEEDFVSFEDGSEEESDGQDEKKKGIQLKTLILKNQLNSQGVKGKH
ncbi:hypothetical protein M0R45_013336 [Rubus argutus]|uniref:Uncharacterized protein n=1 Tax=Rubus argutus TaxID=59490 RepID=A0AAW1XLE5_RUBAR